MSGGISSELGRIFERHQDKVAGLAVSVIFEEDPTGANTSDFGFGYAKKSHGREGPMSPEYFLQCASLSKTVCAAFSIEYFSKKNIDVSTTSVNSVLAGAKAAWRIKSSNPAWDANDVTLSMLLNHTALGMHYVWGIPLTHDFPQPVELLDGSSEEAYGYKNLVIERKPGESFAYSGGGFVVMQYLIETLEGGRPITDLTRCFLDQVGLQDFTFSQKLSVLCPRSKTPIPYATGYVVPFSQAVEPPLAFPPFAAGGLCTTRALSRFLCHLSRAYHDTEGCGGISHSTALLMLAPPSLVDRGALDFMGAKMGLGVFVAAAGPRNRFMFHQAANDGFRGVYLLCFEGPDRGKGCVILANGDNPAVLLQCEVLRLLLGSKGLDISEGIEHCRYKDSDLRLDLEGVKQEAIVNKGLKDLVTFAFINPNPNPNPNLINPDPDRRKAKL